MYYPCSARRVSKCLELWENECFFKGWRFRYMAIESQTGVLKREQVYEQIKGNILSRKIRPGHRLSERNLSEKIGVARGTVRESLQRLINEGFIENVPGVGSVVKTYSNEEARQLFCIREVLEGVAARFAAERINRVQAKELEKLISELEEAFAKGNDKNLTEIDLAIHFKITDIAGNECLKSMIHNCLGLKLMVSGETTMPPKAIAEHRDIVNALIAGDGEKAEKIMRQHIGDAANRLVSSH